MLQITVAALRGHARRLLSAGLAITIGVAFIATTLLLGATMKGSVEQAVADDVAERAVVVTSAEAVIDDATADRLRAIEGITDVREQRQVFTTVSGGGYAMGLSVPPAGSSPEVLEGRMPRASTEAGMPRASAEVALSSTLAGPNALTAGDTFTFTVQDTEPTTVTVVGVVDATDDPALGATPVFFAPNDDLAAWDPEGGIRQLQADAADGYAAQQLRDAVAAELGEGLTVRTGAEQAAFLVSTLTGGADVLTGVLLGFGAVAMLVAAIVIANTFTIVLAQRTREMALLRCVGATRRQVLASVLLEALGLAAVASAVGLLAGVTLSAVVSAWAHAAGLGIPMDHLTVTPASIVVPLLLGIVVTLLAGYAPARRATRVPPLEALHPAPAVTARSRAGVVRLVCAAACIVVGVVALAMGARDANLLIGIGGGIVSFLGVLLASTVLVPATVRLLGAIPSKVAGVPGRLAVDNAVRNPARAAATSAALLVGVTLITMMSVGAASSQRTAEEQIAAQYPVDAAVVAESELPASVARASAQVDGVTASAQVHGALLTLRTGDTEAEHQVVALDKADVAPVLRSAEVVAGLREGALLIEEVQALSMGLQDGDEVSVSAGGPTLTLTALVRESAPALAVTPADLQRVAPGAPLTGVWLRLDDGADPGTVISDLAQVTAGADGARIVGSAPESTQLGQILDVVLLVVTGLLGVAVLIALIGIANTLSLSVLERTRESALLRALGLTRHQLRGMLAAEAVLLAAVSAGLGVMLGTFYGWMGAQTVMPADTAVTVVLPWGRLALVVAVALVAGLLASVLPARRAARVAPATALASV